MEHDYYLILDVPPTADLDAIKKAFRRKVMQCHPDRGGSHAEMVLINEAWEVLSNLELRCRYDEARSQSNNTAAQEAASADSRGARQRAEQYPRRWADVEGWLSQIAGDFASSQHGSTLLFDVWRFPTVKGSYTGGVFIAIGLILGAVIAIASLHNPKEKDTERKMIFLGCAGGLGGAWVGAWLHRAISESIADAGRGRCPNPKCSSKRGWDGQRCQCCGTTALSRRSEHQDDGPAPPAPESRITDCDRCGQKLRVPAMQAELLVTCKSCGHKFAIGSTIKKAKEQDVRDAPQQQEQRSQPQHPKPGSQEWTGRDVLVLAAVFLVAAPFAVYMLSKIGELWGDGKSRDFWGNLRVGVIFVVVVSVGAVIWGKNSKNR